MTVVLPARRRLRMDDHLAGHGVSEDHERGDGAGHAGLQQLLLHDRLHDGAVVGVQDRRTHRE